VIRASSVSLIWISNILNQRIIYGLLTLIIPFFNKLWMLLSFQGLYSAITIIVPAVSKLLKLRGHNHGNFLVIKFIPTSCAVYVSFVVPAGGNFTVAVKNKCKHLVFLTIYWYLKRKFHQPIIFVDLILLVSISLQIYHNNVVEWCHIVTCSGIRFFFAICTVIWFIAF